MDKLRSWKKKKPSLSLLCVLGVISLVLAVTSLFGLCMAIWHAVVLHSYHYVLWDLAVYATRDDRLLHGLNVSMVFMVVGLLVLVGNRFSRDKQNEATLCSSAIQVLSLVAALLLILGHMTAAVLGGAYKSQGLPQVRPALMDLLANHTYMRREPNARWIYMHTGEQFNYLQQKFSCCGLDGPDDYASMQFPRRHEEEEFPYSCCTLKEGALWTDPDVSDVRDLFLCQSRHPKTFYSKGCLPEFQQWLQAKANFLLGYSLFLMLLAILYIGLTVYIIYNVSGKAF